MRYRERSRRHLALRSVFWTTMSMHFVPVPAHRQLPTSTDGCKERPGNLRCRHQLQHYESIDPRYLQCGKQIVLLKIKMNQFRVTACVRVDSRWFGRYAEMCAALFCLPIFLFHRKLRPMKQKRSTRMRIRAKQKHVASDRAGARMCQGTFFLKQVSPDTPHSNIDKNKIPVLRYRKLKNCMK